MRARLVAVVGAGLNALLPPRCVACATALDDHSVDGSIAEGDWCTPCAEQLSAAPAPGLLVYGGPLADLIQRAKYSRDAGSAAALARLFAGRLDVEAIGLVDAITFVPAHPLRVVARGFDLPGLLADAAGARLRVPVRMALRATRRDPRLALSSSAEERARLVAGRFRATHRLAGQKLLLVDDVHTTGATIAEAIATLVSAGASDVVVRTLALTPKDG